MSAPARPPAATLLEALDRRAEGALTPCGDGALVWRLWGPADAPPVLLLHGGSGTWAHWVRNIDALLGAGFQVVAPDMPGFGESASPPDGEDADVLPGWLEDGWAALFGDQPAQAVGFSFGGLVAGLWAAQQPSRFERLVLVGVPALSAVQIAPFDLRDWRQAEGEARAAAHRHNLLQLMLHDPASADALAVAVHAAGVAGDRMRRRRLMRTDLLARTLPGLQCPVAGIFGEHDALYRQRRAVVEPVLATAPRFEGLHWIAQAGHWVAYERAEAFNDALVARLGRAR